MYYKAIIEQTGTKSECIKNYKISNLTGYLQYPKTYRIFAMNKHFDKYQSENEKNFKMKKTVLVIFNDNDAALNAGSNLALRMAEVHKERDVALEVFLFGPAQAAYSSDEKTGMKVSFHANIKKLIQAGIKVSACANAAGDKADALKKDGVQLDFARDAFLNYGAEHASVITF